MEKSYSEGYGVCADMMEVRRMENKAVFLETVGEIQISKRTTPEFLMLYQQSVLLALKEQNVINEMQYGFCLEALSNQFRDQL